MFKLNIGRKLCETDVPEYYVGIISDLLYDSMIELRWK